MRERPSKRKCIVCRQNAAEVPDRNRPGSLIRMVCRRCHADRLIGDLKEVLRVEGIKP
jgi:hypothetical protein